MEEKKEEKKEEEQMKNRTKTQKIYHKNIGNRKKALKKLKDKNSIKGRRNEVKEKQEGSKRQEHGSKMRLRLLEKMEGKEKRKRRKKETRKERIGKVMCENEKQKYKKEHWEGRKKGEKEHNEREK